MLSRLPLFDLFGDAQGRAFSLAEERMIEFNKQTIATLLSTLLQCTLEEVDAGR
mgnify:CR=1 FL=1|tara:strand:+ start:374 stop:535 length:162 start_codon:yes stop_codon:yes gene_type:complete